MIARFCLVVFLALVAASHISGQIGATNAGHKTAAIAPIKTIAIELASKSNSAVPDQNSSPRRSATVLASN